MEPSIEKEKIEHGQKREFGVYNQAPPNSLDSCVKEAGTGKMAVASIAMTFVNL